MLFENMKQFIHKVTNNFLSSWGDSLNCPADRIQNNINNNNKNNIHNNSLVSLAVNSKNNQAKKQKCKAIQNVKTQDSKKSIPANNAINHKKIKTKVKAQCQNKPLGFSMVDLTMIDNDDESDRDCHDNNMMDSLAFITKSTISKDINTTTSSTKVVSKMKKSTITGREISNTKEIKIKKKQSIDASSKSRIESTKQKMKTKSSNTLLSVYDNKTKKQNKSATMVKPTSIKKHQRIKHSIKKNDIINETNKLQYVKLDSAQIKIKKLSDNTYNKNQIGFSMVDFSKIENNNYDNEDSCILDSLGLYTTNENEQKVVSKSRNGKSVTVFNKIETAQNSSSTYKQNQVTTTTKAAMLNKFNARNNQKNYNILQKNVLLDSKISVTTKMTKKMKLDSLVVTQNHSNIAKSTGNQINSSMLNLTGIEDNDEMETDNIMMDSLAFLTRSNTFESDIENKTIISDISKHNSKSVKDKKKRSTVKSKIEKKNSRKVKKKQNQPIKRKASKRIEFLFNENDKSTMNRTMNTCSSCEKSILDSSNVQTGNDIKIINETFDKENVAIYDNVLIDSLCTQHNFDNEKNDKLINKSNLKKLSPSSLKSKLASIVLCKNLNLSSSQSIKNTVHKKTKRVKGTKKNDIKNIIICEKHGRNHGATKVDLRKHSTSGVSTGKGNCRGKISKALDTSNSNVTLEYSSTSTNSNVITKTQRVTRNSLNASKNLRGKLSPGALCQDADSLADMKRADTAFLHKLSPKLLNDINPQLSELDILENGLEKLYKMQNFYTPALKGKLANQRKKRNYDDQVDVITKSKKYPSRIKMSTRSDISPLTNNQSKSTNTLKSSQKTFISSALKSIILGRNFSTGRKSSTNEFVYSEKLQEQENEPNIYHNEKKKIKKSSSNLSFQNNSSVDCLACTGTPDKIQGSEFILSKICMSNQLQISPLTTDGIAVRPVSLMELPVSSHKYKNIHCNIESTYKSIDEAYFPILNEKIDDNCDGSYYDMFCIESNKDHALSLQHPKVINLIKQCDISPLSSQDNPEMKKTPSNRLCVPFVLPFTNNKVVMDVGYTPTLKKTCRGIFDEYGVEKHADEFDREIIPAHSFPSQIKVIKKFDISPMSSILKGPTEKSRSAAQTITKKEYRCLSPTMKCRETQSINSNISMDCLDSLEDNENLNGIFPKEIKVSKVVQVSPLSTHGNRHKQPYIDSNTKSEFSTNTILRNPVKNIEIPKPSKDQHFRSKQIRSEKNISYDGSISRNDSSDDDDTLSPVSMDHNTCKENSDANMLDVSVQKYSQGIHLFTAHLPFNDIQTQHVSTIQVKPKILQHKNQTIKTVLKDTTNAMIENDKIVECVVMDNTKALIDDAAKNKDLSEKSIVAIKHQDLNELLQNELFSPDLSSRTMPTQLNKSYNPIDVSSFRDGILFEESSVVALLSGPYFNLDTDASVKANELNTDSKRPKEKLNQAYTECQANDRRIDCESHHHIIENPVVGLPELNEKSNSKDTNNHREHKPRVPYVDCVRPNEKSDSINANYYEERNPRVPYVDCVTNRPAESNEVEIESNQTHKNIKLVNENSFNEQEFPTTQNTTCVCKHSGKVSSMVKSNKPKTRRPISKKVSKSSSTISVQQQLPSVFQRPRRTRVKTDRFGYGGNPPNVDRIKQPPVTNDVQMEVTNVDKIKQPLIINDVQIEVAHIDGIVKLPVTNDVQMEVTNVDKIKQPLIINDVQKEVANVDGIVQLPVTNDEQPPVTNYVQTKTVRLGLQFEGQPVLHDVEFSNFNFIPTLLESINKSNAPTFEENGNTIINLQKIPHSNKDILPVDDWSSEQLNQLRESRENVDPTSKTFWWDVATQVDGKTAEECQKRWYSFVKTPLPKYKRKISKKVADAAAAAKKLISVDHDDIFNATPMRDLLVNDGIIFTCDDLSPIHVDNGISSVDYYKKRRESSSTFDNDDKTYNSEFYKPTLNNYKNYIKGMKRDITKQNKLKKKVNTKKNIPKLRTLTDTYKNGDINMNIRLSPSGNIKINDKTEVDDVDDFWNEMYNDEDSYNDCM